ncbi:MAG: hypothetical protein EP343_30880 [Deltaproteobacteria bacterium]|nr:MAG: hypothetical protein EP343_30880 [Deltaproteobacteria bacterium]
MARYPLGFVLILAFLFGAISIASAGPRTKRGACGSVLPNSSKSIGKQRYSVWYPKTMYSLLKFYRKVFGSRNPDYKVSKLFTVPGIVAHHLKNNSGKGRWKGMNLVHYKRKGKVQIYVICKKASNDED